MNWRLVFTKKAEKDAKKVATSGLKEKAEILFKIITEDPYKTTPPYEKLVGDLTGACSRRINIQHRLVYQVIEDEKTVKVLRMWTHFE